MHIRAGFARLLPLAAIFGLGVGIGALLVSARGVREPARTACCGAGDDCHRKQLGAALSMYAEVGGEVRRDASPAPANGIRDANGRFWELSEIPGHALWQADLRNARWAGVDAHGAEFAGCDFRGSDLSRADLEGVEFECCDLRGAKLEGANLAGAVSYRTKWPRGLETAAERSKRGVMEGVGP